MNQNKWLILPIEVKHREFLSRIVLAALALERGFDVLLGKDTAVRRMAPALPRGVIFDKSLGTVRHGKPQRFHKIGHKVAVFDEESTGFYGSPDQFLSVRLANETLAACEHWYCISETVRKSASEKYPTHSKKFITTGIPRTDTWRQEFHGFYAHERDAIKDEHGPFILFNSNFGGIIHARGDAFVQKQIRGQKQAYSEVEKRTSKIFEQGHHNLEAFTKLLPKLTDWFPNHRLAIRPHPSETVEYWQQQFSGNDRIVISNKGVATPWILASDLLLHHGCTTGIEAAILGKKHIMYAPFPDEHHDTDVMKTFAQIVHTESELQAEMKKQLSGKSAVFDKRKGEKFFANLTGKLVNEHILQSIEEIAFLSEDLPATLPLSVKLRMWLADNKKRSDKEKTYSKQKWPGTNIKEIRQMLQIAGKGLGQDTNFEITEPFPELFHIRKTI